MNEGKTLQLVIALALVAFAFVSAALAGANVLTLAIVVCTGGMLIAIFRYGGDTDDAPATLARSNIPEPDLIGLEGFRRIIDGLLDPVLVVQKGKVTAANTPALSLLGSHIVGGDVRMAIRHPAAAERLTTAEVLDGRVKIDIVGLGTRSQRWAMRIIPIDAPGGQQRLFVHLADESDMHAAERVKGDFVANASHELRTPLAAIIGFVETLQDPKAGADEETRGRFLSIVHNEAQRMQQLVDDLMSLSRIEADKHRLPTELIDMKELIEEVITLSRQNLGPRGVDIQSDVAENLGQIRGDRTQVSQLLHNLIGNSAKYGRPGTPIIIRLRGAKPAMLRLDVMDEGEGIADDHLPRLTERFYRVDPGRSRAMGGTGLGLAIVKHIVERHRGRLEITSTAGKGTTVSVLLPLLDPADATDQKPVPATLS